MFLSLRLSFQHDELCKMKPVSGNGVPSTHIASVYYTLDIKIMARTLRR